MTTFVEGMHAGEFIVSELPNLMSRANGTLLSGNDLQPGTVLGKVTASEKWTQLAPAASDGSEVAAGILYDQADAGVADVPCVVIYWAADVNAGELVWPDGIQAAEKDAAAAQLAAVKIRVQ